MLDRTPSLSTSGWWSVSLSGITVIGDFYVAMQFGSSGLPRLGLDFEYPAPTRSYTCFSNPITCYPADKTNFIRAEVDPLNPISPAPVGGFIEPANKFAIFAPWLGVIGLVGCIGAVVVVAKKREK